MSCRLCSAGARRVIDLQCSPFFRQKRYLMSATAAITLPLISGVLVPSREQRDLLPLHHSSPPWQRCEEDTFRGARKEAAKLPQTGRKRGTFSKQEKEFLLWLVSASEARSNNVPVCVCELVVLHMFGCISYINGTK